MEFNLSSCYNDLLFVPLGGTDRIGMNFYAYHYKGKWLIIDMGLGFAESSTPGVEILLPLPIFIEQNKEDVVGLVLTHAHEDHIGAVPYLWNKIGCKIYTSPFTAALLKAKFAESRTNDKATIIEVDPREALDLEPFSLEFITITHSIPEMKAILIKTQGGNIFHTGDWKFDPDPVLGGMSDMDKLRKIGDDGVLALVCDSTNIYEVERSGSEGELSKSLKNLISTKCNKDGMIVVTTFASNVARVHSIIKAAESVNRKVILAGRSLWKLYNTAQDCGYLENTQECLPATEIKNYKRNEVLVICTGCQGEILASTTKISYNTHPDISMTKGDSIIFSSSIVPGNERKVLNTLNRFCKMGVETFTEKDHFVHVSGHPGRDEVMELYNLLRPKIVVPMHGEYIHIHEHYKFAKANGIEFSIESDVGDVIKLSATGPEKLGTVETGTLIVDGSIIIDKNSSIIHEREIMRDNGAVVVLLLVNQRGKLVRQPKIFAPGVLEDHQEDRELLDMLIEDIRDTFPQGTHNLRSGDKSVKKMLGIKIKKVMRKFRKKDPYVLIHIEQITL